MFEAVVTLCLSLSPEVCRESLIPGHAARTEAACAESLGRADFDPAPLVAKGPPACRPEGPALDFTEVSPGLFVHEGAIEEWSPENRGDIANIAFVVGEGSVAVIDAGSAAWMGEGVLRAVRRVTDRPVSHLVLTHVHPDHVLGAGPIVDAGAEVVGHEGLPRALADRAGNYLESLARLIAPADAIGTRTVEVDHAVEEMHEIDLGGRVLEVRAWPTAHTGTDLTVMDRATGTLLAGDLLFDGHVPALDGSLRGWQSVLGDLEGVEAAAVVPGHGGPRLPWPEGAQAEARYLDVLARDTRAALDQGLRLGEAVRVIAQGEADAWLLFGAFNARNATVAYTELEWE